MKIPFRMPVELPRSACVNYSFINAWRMSDGLKICKRHELEISGISGIDEDEARRLVNAIRDANPEADYYHTLVETNLGYDDEHSLTLRLDEELLDRENEYAPLAGKLDEQKPIEWSE